MEVLKNRIEITADNHLNVWVLKSKKSAIYETIFGFAILGFFGFLMYQKSSDNLVWFILGICGLLFYGGIYTYGGTIRRGRIINSTVKTLVFSNNTIEIRTFSYNILGLKNLLEKKIQINRDKLIVKESDYPIMDKKTIQGKILSVSDINGKSYYIIPQFFPEEIKGYLT